MGWEGGCARGFNLKFVKHRSRASTARITMRKEHLQAGFNGVHGSVMQDSLFICLECFVHDLFSLVDTTIGGCDNLFGL